MLEGIMNRLGFNGLGKQTKTIEETKAPEQKKLPPTNPELLKANEELNNMSKDNKTDALLKNTAIISSEFLQFKDRIETMMKDIPSINEELKIMNKKLNEFSDVETMAEMNQKLDNLKDIVNQLREAIQENMGAPSEIEEADALEADAEEADAEEAEAEEADALEADALEADAEEATTDELDAEAESEDSGNASQAGGARKTKSKKQSRKTKRKQRTVKRKKYVKNKKSHRKSRN